MPDESKVVKAPADAESFAEYKTLRQPPSDLSNKDKPEASAAPRPPAKIEEKVEKVAEPAAPESEDEGETEGEAAASADGQGPSPKEPHKKRSAENRISELTAKYREEERKRQALEQELATLRAAKPAAVPPPATPAPAPPKAEAAALPEPVVSKPRPEVDRFDTYEDYVEALTDWKTGQAQLAWEKSWETKQAEREQEQRRLSTQRTFEDRIAAAVSKHPDFVQVTAGDVVSGTGMILKDETWAALLQMDDGFDILYKLGKSPDDLDRIKRLPAMLQVMEVGAFAAKMASAAGNGLPPAPAAAPPIPDPQKPAVSRVPKPPTPVGGAEAPAPKSTADALSYAEHRSLRQAAMRH